MKHYILITAVLAAASSLFAQDGGIYLTGNFNEWSNDKDPTMEFTYSGDHYVLFATLPAGNTLKDKYLKFKVYDLHESGQKNRGIASEVNSDKELDLNGSIKGLNSYAGSGSESSVTLNTTQPLRICFEYWPKYRFSGDSGDNYHSALKATVCPENMYIFGNIRNQEWSSATSYSYMAECDENGVYQFDDVYVAGHKSSSSGQLDGKNYIAFYGADEAPTADNNGKLYPIFKGGNSGETDGYNVVISENDLAAGDPISKSIKAFLASGTSYNYCLPDGMYDITVDMRNLKVSFTRVPEEQYEYKWHRGEGQLIDGDVITIGFGQDHEIRLSSRSILEHDAAKKAHIEIEYVSQTEPDVPEEDEEMNDYYEPDDVARKANESPAYMIDEDNRITLYKVGTYKITASLPDENMSEYIGIKPATLTAIVTSVVTNVTEIVTEEAAPVYYTLQGVRVSKPEKGLYIVVRGNRVTKELLK